MSDVGGIAADRLRNIVNRIERLDGEKLALQDDIKEVYAEAKAAGFEGDILRQLIRLRTVAKADREEQDTLVSLYMEALEMVDADDDGLGMIGHNSMDADRLKTLIDRIERLEEEKAGVQEDIKEMFAEAKATGFDNTVLRRVLRLRKMGAADRREKAVKLNLYKAAVGMV